LDEKKKTLTLKPLKSRFSVEIWSDSKGLRACLDRRDKILQFVDKLLQTTGRKMQFSSRLDRRFSVLQNLNIAILILLRLWNTIPQCN
jgi:hypothetical protein